MMETGEEVWQWRPSEHERLADYPHEAWVNDEGWSVARLHEWFHAGILVISPEGECRMLRPLQGFDGETNGILQDESDAHIGGTSAGPNWESSSIACFHYYNDKPFWSIRTWWGRRITIDLEAGAAVDEVSGAQDRVISETEEAWIVSQLQRASPELDSRDETDPDWWRAIASPIYAAAYHAGQLKVRETVPILRHLEANSFRGYGNSAAWLGITHLPFRLIAKVSLLQLHVKPQWLANFELKNRRTGERCNYPARRLEHPASIREGISQRDVLEIVGVPEYLEDEWDYWLFDDGATFSIQIHWQDKHKSLIDWRDTENAAARFDDYRVAVEREPPVVSRVERSDVPPWSSETICGYSIAHFG